MRQQSNNKMSFEHDSDWDSPLELIKLAQALADSDTHRATFDSYLHAAAEQYPEVDYYRKNGDWRSTEVAPNSQSTRQSITKSAPYTEPNSCYKNAQTACHLGAAVYAEGYVIIPDDDIAIPHAWLEVNGTVLDITPPISERDAQTLYFGISVPRTQLVLEALEVNNRATPVVEYLLSDSISSQKPTAESQTNGAPGG